jgi:3-methylfumaryl-CoA hydratase
MSDPSLIDLEHLRQWVGETRAEHDIATVRHARLMAATLDRDGLELRAGEPLPPLWHWIYFLEGLPRRALGPDGHPARGGFLPPVPLPNRMWAGGRIEFETPILLGVDMERRSQVVGVDHKRGRAGDLVFVTVLHELLVDGIRAIREEQDIVYRQPASPNAGAGSPVAPRPKGRSVKPWLPDSTQLFRYSALTFNSHRIHYDQDYCRQIEGYSDLVVQGPLSATMLAAYAEEVGGRPLKRFSYRGLRPSLLGMPLLLNSHVEGNRAMLWSASPEGDPFMHADVELR